MLNLLHFGRLVEHVQLFNQGAGEVFHFDSSVLFLGADCLLSTKRALINNWYLNCKRRQCCCASNIYNEQLNKVDPPFEFRRQTKPTSKLVSLTESNINYRLGRFASYNCGRSHLCRSSKIYSSYM